LQAGRLPDLPTHHGIQPPIWPIPAATQSVRLVSRRRRKADAALPVAVRAPVRPVLLDTPAAHQLRETYAASSDADELGQEPASPEVPRSPAPSKRGRSRQQP
jgi:hypothetical protein